ncbi:KAP family P-loop NTPase fold protein [Segatella buccae]|uniref:KAP family P-loop NTPase fold protein n=1 Tax=Segatella buccae TaxID=28126 RepID=UPI003FD6C422
MANKMWKDCEAELDLLNFSYLSEQVAEIAEDDNLSPATIGIYGDWGSGKSTLMKLTKKLLDSDQNTLTVEFNGWLFEGYEDAKTALCGTILDAMHNAEKKNLFVKGKDKIAELLKQVDKGKLLSKGIKYGLDFFLTGSVRTITELTLTGLISSIKQKAGDVSEGEIKKLIDTLKTEDTKRTEIKNFRKTFKEIFDDCKNERLVVFIDELDRCTPDTILDIFEAIRLFLYVPGATFIIGADERLVSYAVKTKYRDIPGHDIDISKEYLEKLVQYPVKIPQLNEQEVKQYITCLLLQIEDLDFKTIAQAISNMGINDEFTIESVKAALGKEPTEKIKEAFDLSNQIYSSLATLMKGNPRHCKRFFNTLMMRISLAEKRQITLQKKVLAKLMLAEYYKPTFIEVLMNPESKGELKQLENGDNESAYTILKDWVNDEWVQKWVKGEPLLSSISNLSDYFYFSRESRKIYSSNAEILSTQAKILLQNLLDSSEAVRNKAIEAASQLAPSEQILLSKAMFEELIKEENIDGKKFKSYLELTKNQNQQKEAVAKIMSLPNTRITAGLVGQMTAFVNTLDIDTKEILKTYLLTNNKLNTSVGIIFK